MYRRGGNFWELKRRLRRPEIADLTARILAKLNSGEEPSFESEYKALAYKLSRGGRRILTPQEIYSMADELYRAARHFVKWDVLSNYLLRIHRKIESLMLIYHDEKLTADYSLLFDAMVRLFFIEMLIVATSFSYYQSRGLYAIDRELRAAENMLHDLKLTIQRKVSIFS